jgi:glycosyltransferase involved in cell wall biosynthesis
MNVLFLGYAIHEEEVSKLYGASVAGNKMQLNILEHLSNYSDISFKSITVYPTAAYPKGKLFIRGGVINLFNNIYTNKVGFINFPVIKQLLLTLKVFKEAQKIIEDNNVKVIFTFNMFPQIGLPAKWLKKKYGVEVVSLLADLPIDDRLNRRGLSRILRNWFDKLTKNSITHCDKVIVLNKNAAKRFAPNVEYITIDGGFNIKEYVPQNKEIHRKPKKNIVFSGALIDYNGIVQLIEAMNLIKDQEVVLEIYGGGQLSEYVRSASEKHNNIKYLGMVDNITMRKIQREAYLLINPRAIDDPISEVTFPSKIFEYMLSGTPVLSTKLNGFTEDYFDKMFFVDSNEPKILATKIDEIINIPPEELRAKAYKAQQYVLNNKSWEKQCEKIYKFMSNNSVSKYKKQK